MVIRMTIYTLNHYIAGGNVRILRDRDKSKGVLAVYLALLFIQDKTKQILVSAFLGGN